MCKQIWALQSAVSAAVLDLTLLVLNLLQIQQPYITACVPVVLHYTMPTPIGPFSRHGWDNDWCTYSISVFSQCEHTHYQAKINLFPFQMEMPGPLLYLPWHRNTLKATRGSVCCHFTWSSLVATMSPFISCKLPLEIFDRMQCSNMILVRSPKTETFVTLFHQICISK